jgi:Skp family chaperone for outer membrane proteins
MILPQIVENLTVTNVSASSPQISSGELHAQLSSSTNFKRTPKALARELYVQIKDEVAYQIIKQGLSKAESKLFFYFLLLDRFGDRPVRVKVAEILHETGISKSVYHLAIAKFQKRGWFGFTQADVQISNFCTPTKKSKKQDIQSEKQDIQSEKQDIQSEKQDIQSKKQDSEELEPLPTKVSETPQTLQTYSDLLHTLPEEQRESFKKFCLKKIQELSFKIGSKEAWLNKYGAEYLEEFKETYSYALANPEVIPPKATPFDIPDIAYLKRLYRDDWKDAAIHFGLIDPDSPEEEIQDESEPVASLEVVAKPITDSNNPQEPTPPTPAIGPKHRKFAKGNTVVIAEVGNIHKGETGKITFASFGSQEDEYRISLDKESHSVREVTIKIPKPCGLTYLVSSRSSSKR